ncbi:hypothetical protein [Sinanaerobacter sp. ZZT-01]|uniref:hypothetical protein n=1 Tax=Sinanaerobacter sp. ZZT-01 TaxID=3111540 RepID=UPI002D797190|nr:hypothetical protein [Sinanaerobacter sp. ZZT-01]WRR94081.1 hypothetical protein U5921_02885 [Sinanaerobacter sp. ZZT-01]
MIVLSNKGFETHSMHPNEDWTGKALYVVEDESDLANKIQRLYPHYDFVVENGQLVDVIEIEKPPLTDEEKIQQYDELSIQYIHEKYSYDEENKTMREYLSDMTNEQCKVAFDTYNTYVEECKTRAYTEVYGN